MRRTQTQPQSAYAVAAVYCFTYSLWFYSFLFRIPPGTSKELTDLLMGLLRRNAKERMNFDTFFNHAFLQRQTTPHNSGKMQLSSISKSNQEHSTCLFSKLNFFVQTVLTNLQHYYSLRWDNRFLGKAIYKKKTRPYLQI